MVRDSGEVASVDDPATVEFFPCPLGRQGVWMLFAQDPALPLAFLGADPGELVQGGQGPGMLGAKYPAPVAEDRVEDPPGFTEPAPLLVRDRPCEFVAGQQGPGIVRAQDADAFIEGFLVARFGGNYP